jgi:CheY-like chemotaxis protein
MSAQLTDAGVAPAPALVMLVDDHSDSADMYAFALRTMNIQCLTAATSDEAYALACAHQPDVVVSDLRLQSASGLDLARRLRASRETSDAAIIILTGHAEPSARSQAQAIGCDRFLVKPCPPADLASAIRELLATRRKPATA